MIKRDLKDSCSLLCIFAITLPSAGNSFNESVNRGLTLLDTHYINLTSL